MAPSTALSFCVLALATTPLLASAQQYNSNDGTGSNPAAIADGDGYGDSDLTIPTSLPSEWVSYLAADASAYESDYSADSVNNPLPTIYTTAAGSNGNAGYTGLTDSSGLTTMVIPTDYPALGYSWPAGLGPGSSGSGSFSYPFPTDSGSPHYPYASGTGAFRASGTGVYASGTGCTGTGVMGTAPLMTGAVGTGTASVGSGGAAAGTNATTVQTPTLVASGTSMGQATASPSQNSGAGRLVWGAAGMLVTLGMGMALL